MDAHSWQGPTDRMPEGEVTIRLAEFLSELPHCSGRIEAAIDGASVRVKDAVIFDIEGYLAAHDWVRLTADTSSRNSWTGTYARNGSTLRVHSHPGQGDVVAEIGGRRLLAECKKGPLTKRPGSPEYPLLTTAIGQALLLPADKQDLVVAAVPDTPTFRRLAEAWRERPKLVQSGLQILLVARSGNVDGLWL